MVNEFYYGAFIMPFPEKIIKGIPKKKHYISDGYIIGSNLFNFKDNSRPDQKWETSINWDDDDDAINFSFNQKNSDDTLQFKGGLVLLPRIELDHLIRQPKINGLLSYEREPIPPPQINKYHGNILITGNTPKLHKKSIAGSMALLISEEILRD